MSGLFGALWLALQGAAGIHESIEKKEALSKPSYTASETGQPVYHDNNMRAYGRNGEKLDARYTTMPNGELRIQMVGKRSGIVYEDSYARKMQRINERDAEELKREKKYGHLAYLKYHEMYKNRYTTEISTGKIIAAIYGNDFSGTYRKFYLKGNEKLYSRTDAAEGDYGIPITKEEYQKYDISGGIHSKIPPTYDSIGKQADPYYGIEDKYLFERMNGEDKIGEKCEFYSPYYDTGIVKDTDNYTFIIKSEKHKKNIAVRPCMIRTFLGKESSQQKCIVIDNGIEKQGIVKKIENGKYLVEFSDGSTRYVDGRFGNLKLLN